MQRLIPTAVRLLEGPEGKDWIHCAATGPEAVLTFRQGALKAKSLVYNTLESNVLLVKHGN